MKKQSVFVKMLKTIFITLGIFTGLIIIISVIIAIFSPSPKNNLKQPPSKSEINKLTNSLSHDSLYQIKDVYYNPKDSSLNIAFTNKDNIIKDGDYSTYYFKKNYNIDNDPWVEGIYLYAYEKGKSFEKGDYPHDSYLTCESSRAGRLLDYIEKNYCPFDVCVPLKWEIKKYLKDPGSYSSQSVKIDWIKDSLFEVTNIFRAKNSFGALTLNKATAVIDPHGNISNLKIESE